MPGHHDEVRRARDAERLDITGGEGAALADEHTCSERCLRLRQRAPDRLDRAAAQRTQRGTPCRVGLTEARDFSRVAADRVHIAAAQVRRVVEFAEVRGIVGRLLEATDETDTVAAAEWVALAAQLQADAARRRRVVDALDVEVDLLERAAHPGISRTTPVTVCAPVIEAIGGGGVSPTASYRACPAAASATAAISVVAPRTVGSRSAAASASVEASSAVIHHGPLSSAPRIVPPAYAPVARMAAGITVRRPTR